MTFIKRTLTLLVGLPIVILLCWFGGLPFLIACCVAALVGLREFYCAFSKKDRPVHAVGYIATVGYFAAIYAFGVGYWLLITLTLFIVVVQTCLVVFYKKLPVSESISTVYGFLYVPFLLSFVVLVRLQDLGFYYVWLIFIASFGCDTFAYITGSLFGKRKLKNSPSPSKSVEGLIGGVIGATLIGVGYGLVLYRFSSEVTALEAVLFIAVICFFGAIFSIIGDLAASAIKRHCEIKDFGKLFPGHGGVMDRIDSIVMVAPVVYIVTTVMYLMFA